MNEVFLQCYRSRPDQTLATMEACHSWFICLNFTMWPDLINRRFAAEQFCKKSKLCSCWIQMSTWKGWNICTREAWNHAKLLGVCSAVWSAAKAKTENCSWQVWYFPGGSTHLIAWRLGDRLVFHSYPSLPLEKCTYPKREFHLRKLQGTFRASHTKGGTASDCSSAVIKFQCVTSS